MNSNIASKLPRKALYVIKILIQMPSEFYGNLLPGKSSSFSQLKDKIFPWAARTREK
jgi:hypothetical protein